MGDEQMSLTLYYAPGACSLVPHVALEEAGAAFDTVRLSLADGDQRKPDYLVVNPKGRVPTLVVSGRSLTEVIAILTYLDRRFPGADILPGPDPYLTGRAYEVMSWFASTVHVAFAQITRAERYADDPHVKSALAAPGRERFVRALDAIETLAASKDAWLVGNAFSAVDAYALVIRRWAERIGVDLSAYPAWTAKADRALQRPSVVRALAHESAPVSAVAA
jgi:glutathione S-transferase